MEALPNGLRAELDSITARLDRLERCVQFQVARQAAREPEAAPKLVPDAHPLTSALLPLIGKALTGLAGAYLLRAVAETGVVPPVLTAAAGLLYAALWLLWSARTAQPDPARHAVYAATAAVIISPMLWETTVRFGVLTPPVTAACLVIFVLCGTALAWRHNVRVIAAITTLAAVGTAVALILATRALVPFTAALLAIAIIAEYAACRDHFAGERWVVAAAADASVLLLTFVATRPQGIPEGYPPMTVAEIISLQIGLLLIYLATVAYRTLVHRLDIGHLEVAQVVAAFGIAISGALRVAKGDPVAAAAVGIACTVSGLVCYAISFLLFSREESRRNFRVYSAFAFALLLFGSSMLLSDVALPTGWALFALIAAGLSIKLDSVTMRVNAALYLAAAAAVSGLATYSLAAMLDASTGLPSAAASLVVAAAAVCCAATGAPERTPVRRMPDLLIAGITCAGVLGITTAVTEDLLTAVLPGRYYFLPAIGTAWVCLMAVALTYLASRALRPEFLWLIYPLMGFGGLKLVMRDLAMGRPVMLAVSLLFYGGALIILPRRMRAVKLERPDEALQSMKAAVG